MSVNYLNFSTSVANTCKFTITGTLSTTPTLYYMINSGEWTAYTFGNDISLSAGDTVYFKGDNNSFSESASNRIGFSSTVGGNLSGNVMTLVDSSGESVTIPCDYCFYNLFGNATIVSCNGLELPATTLAPYCYSMMFNGNIVLTTTPELPAMTLATGCYSSMFNACSKLITAPELPATSLADYCYKNMFSQCNSLITAPELPATSLATHCYDQMFWWSTKLTTPPSVLPATTLAPYCYDSMFKKCSSLTTAPEIKATTLATLCCESMFEDCSSLTKAPSELSATTVLPSCYQCMFCGCTVLATSPKLPATTLADGCYYSMFRDCKYLTTAPELPATTLKPGCYDRMFYGCTALTKIVVYYNNSDLFSYTSNWVTNVSATGTFVCPTAVGTESTITRGVSACPTNWTVGNMTDLACSKIYTTSYITKKIKKIKYLTQAEYTALTSKDVNTEYRITDYVSLELSDLHIGATTLDATLVANKQYILTSQSATFAMVLPTTATYNDSIEVIFPATGAFTPTSSGGTVVGDSLPTTVSGKTYDILFTWVGSGWLVNWLAW